MSLPGNGIFVVQGEMAMLVTAMRRSTRWGSNSYHNEEYDVLMRTFQDLKSILYQVDDLRSLDPGTYLSPFLEVIRSKETTGPVTSLALSAIHKFLSYGLIDPTHPNVPATVEDIAEAVTHARFVGTDHSSDGVVLMKILQVLRTLMLSPEGVMLTDESVCEIMLSCFRICFKTELTELLRRNAEHCLRDMTQLIFMRLPQFPSDELSVIMPGAGLSLKTRDKGKKSSSNNQNSADRNSSVTEQTSTTTLESENEAKIEALRRNQDKKLLNIAQVTIEPAEPIKSPKKHNRHSSMDLAANGNTSITQLIDKCVAGEGAVEQEHGNKEEEVNVEEGENSMEDTEDVKEEKTPDPPELDGVEASKPEDQVEPTKPESPVEDADKAEDNGKLEEYVNHRGIRFTPQQDADNLQPYGLACVRELFRFLISLCNPLDTQNNSAMVHIGLSMVGTALEVAADHIAKYPSLLHLVKDPLCRNLLSLLGTERISIFTLDLQVSFLLFEALRYHLKFQMEAFFKNIIEIVSADTTKSIYELKEIHHLALESIIHLFRIPGLCTELYLNYDCDVYCINVFEEITKLLSKNVVSSTAYNIHSLSLDALLTIIEAIESSVQVKSEMEIANVEVEKETKYGRSGHVTLELGGMDDASVVPDNVTHDISHYVGSGRTTRHKATAKIPTEAELDNIKNMKKWVTQGTELFNQKPEKGIEFLQEHGVLATPLVPHEVAMFLRGNPDLDKKMIGEYICKRSSRAEDAEGDVSVLSAFADSFEYSGLRIEQALRLYLETFRLPGEAPLIFLVMERFAERWHTTNGEPFANTDAAFRLAYAVIMLNMDQHNHNAKKLNVPMTVEDFVKNLRGCNGSGDFEQTMLEQVFYSIKNEEMVMPAERVGALRDSYLWRVLQRRGATSAALYRLAAYPHAHNARLLALACPPTVTALSAAFERAPPPTMEEVEANNIRDSAALLALQGLERCAALVARLPPDSITVDTLVLTLCKFTGLLSPQYPNYIAIGVFVGQSSKAQSALTRACAVAARHADCLRDAWRHLLEIVKTLYIGRLLPKCLVEAEDYLSQSGTVSLIREAARGSEAGLLSSIYSYIALGESGMRAPTSHEKALIDSATECVSKCNLPGLLITETKFLQIESLQELIRAMMSVGMPPDSDSVQLNPQLEDITIFFFELLGQTLIQNRDRVVFVWSEVSSHLSAVLRWSCGGDACSRVLRRVLTALLRCSARLMRCDHCAPAVLQHLTVLFSLPYKLFYQQADVISCGMYELVKTSAQNVHSAAEWDTVFALLCAAGAGAWPVRAPPTTLTTSSRSEGSEDESDRRPTSVSSESELSNSPQTQGWILVNRSLSTASVEGAGVATNVSEGGDTTVSHDGVVGEEWETEGVLLRAHRATALSRCCEALALVVRDVAHVTPYNCRAAVRAVRLFAQATLRTGKKPNKGRKSRPNSSRRRGYEDSSDEEEDTLVQYRMVSIQLLDLMHTLHSRTAQIFKWWKDEAEQSTEDYDLWEVAWKPLLQGIAHFCTDRRKLVSNSAIAYLQRALLVPGLSGMGGSGWEACFHCVLFPLLDRLQRHPRRVNTAARANTIMCKVFLQHLSALSSRPSFSTVWCSVIDVQRALVSSQSDDPLTEAALESLKNMILVMDSVRIFSNGYGYNELWYKTWEKIGEFLPDLKEELFPQVKDNRKSPTNVQNHMQTPLPTIVPIGPSTPTILPQPRPIHVQIGPGLAQSSAINKQAMHSPVNISQTPPLLSNTPTLVAPTPVSGMVPIRNPLYDHTSLTSSVLLQPLNEMISTPISVSIQSQMPIIYPQTTNGYQTQLPASDEETHIDKQMEMTTQNTLIDIQYETPQMSTQNAQFNTNLQYDTQNVQQSELYAEYLTNPYNDREISLNEAHLDGINSPIGDKNVAIIDNNVSIIDNVSIVDPGVSIIDTNVPIIDKKSSSEHTTPMRNKTQFVSTDNVRQESGIFNFYSYFSSGQAAVGSEVFDSLMTQTQEG